MINESRGGVGMTDETWGTIRKELIGAVGRNNYVSWIEPLRFAELQDGVATFHVPTEFVGDWVKRNFSDHILRHLARAGESVSRIEFAVPRRNFPEPPKPELLSAEPTAPMEDDRGAAALDPKYSFDTFVVGKPNELAHAAARRVAEGEVTFNPLFLYGGVGLGKTHLMHAIGWEVLRRRPDAKVVYLSAEQFMYRFVTALRDRQMMSFKEIFRSVDVLMVDDVQFIAGKDSTQEEFFHTFNVLVEQNRQIVLSADRPPVEIGGLENRIVSRLQSGLAVDVHPTSFELRLGILQRKMEYYHLQFPNVRLADGVLEFLAHRISSNVRVLEGALLRLFAFSSLVPETVTVEMTQECLSDILRASDRKITIEEIQRKVSDHYNIRMSDLVGPKRVRNLARPRQVAMWLAKHLTARSLPDIGKRFGNRDHTTVIHGVRRIEELKGTDAQIAEDLEILRRALEA